MVHIRQIAEDVSHADSQRNGTAGASVQVKADMLFIIGQIGYCKIRVRSQQSLISVMGGVNRKIVARHHGAGGNQSHNRHKAFGQHCTVTDKQNFSFVADHFRCRSGADNCMETGDCAAGNGNENKRQNRTVDNRAAALVKRGKHMHHMSG